MAIINYELPQYALRIAEFDGIAANDFALAKNASRFSFDRPIIPLIVMSNVALPVTQLGHHPYWMSEANGSTAKQIHQRTTEYVRNMGSATMLSSLRLDAIDFALLEIPPSTVVLCLHNQVGLVGAGNKFYFYYLERIQG